MQKYIFCFFLLFYSISFAEKHEEKSKISPQVLTLGIGFIPNIQFAPLYAADELKFYQAKNIKLEINYGFGMDIFSLLQSGKMDIGLADSEQFLTAVDKGLPVKALMQYAQYSPISIVALAEKANKPEDLIGKTIGVPELYGTSFIGLQLFLRKYNLLNKVKVVKIGYTQLTSLLSKKIDAVVVYTNNEMVQLIDNNTPITVWNISEDTNYAGAVFVVDANTYQKNPAAFKNFAKATKEGMIESCAKIDKSVEISMKYTKALEQNKKNILAKIFTATCKIMGNENNFGEMNALQWKNTIDNLYSLKLLNKVFDFNKHIID